MISNMLNGLMARAQYEAGQALNKVKAKAAPAAASLGIGFSAASMLLGASADASQTAQDLFGNVVSVVATICIIAGIIFFVWGMVGIGLANTSDNGGQEKDKAQKKIFGAIVVIVIGAVLIGLKSALTDYISGAIDDANS